MCVSGDGRFQLRHVEDDRGVSLKVAKERAVWTFVGKLFQALRGKKQRHLRWEQGRGQMANGKRRKEKMGGDKGVR